MKTFAALLLLCCIITNSADHWPQFRGPNGSGVAPDDQAPPTEFGPEQNVLWKTALPGGHSSPCIWDDRIFIAAHDRESKKLEVICLDRRSGKVLWRHAVAPEKLEKVHAISSAATSTPATDGKHVIFYFGSYGLLAYDFEGKLTWEKKLPTPIIMRNFGSGVSPIIVGDAVILDLPLAGKSELLAFRSSNGDEIWKVAKPNHNSGWATPITFQDGDEKLIGILNIGRFTAHDPKTGEERWWISGLPNQICATPAVGEGVLFLTGTGVLGNKENIIRPPAFAGMLSKYDTDKNGKLSIKEIPEDLLIADRGSGGPGNMTLRQGVGGSPETEFDEEKWEAGMKSLAGFLDGDLMKTSALAVRTGGKQDVTASHIAWTETKSVPEVPSPLLYRNRLYYVKNGGVLTCRDPKTGHALFEERLNAAGGYYASPVAAGGRILTASDRGVVTVLEAADELKILSQNNLGEPIMATTAIIGGKLYIRTAQHLYAFGK